MLGIFMRKTGARSFEYVGDLYVDTPHVGFVLLDMFSAYNRGTCNEKRFSGPGMSVGDMVIVIKNEFRDFGAFVCQSHGWSECASGRFVNGLYFTERLTVKIAGNGVVTWIDDRKDKPHEACERELDQIENSVFAASLSQFIQS